MKVEEITVHAGRTFKHPYEQYSNSKPGVSMRAVLEDGEDVDVAVKKLQAKAESLVEDHKRNLLQAYKDEYNVGPLTEPAGTPDNSLTRSRTCPKTKNGHLK